MIEVKNLTKKYGDNTAVDNLSFTIENGKIYGFLGPNGAGKSTTMNMVTGCLAATDGQVLIDGYDIFENPTEAKKRIGYLPELPPLYPEMTPAEYLKFVCEAKKIKRNEIAEQVEYVMSVTQLHDVKNRLIKNLSKGYKQRVGIAQAMLGNPDVIILDEPTVGLDPKQIIEIRELIESLGRDRTVILSSHILSEISAICNHIMVISHGRLVANDTIENMSRYIDDSDNMTLIVRGNIKKVQMTLNDFAEIKDYKLAEAKDEGANVYKVYITVASNVDIREKLFFAFAEQQMPILSSNVEKADLETVFLRLTEGISDEEIEKTAAIEAARETEESKSDSNKKSYDDDDDYKPMFS